MSCFSVLFSLFLFYPGHRYLLLFYNEKGKPLQEKQLTILQQDRTGLKERDLVTTVYRIEDNSSVFKKWHIDTSRPFTLLLVGKDGGEKYRVDSPVTTIRLFDIIDAMPMRRSEIKH